jgi:hypothetical protein
MQEQERGIVDFMELHYVADLCKAFELFMQLLGLAGQC